MRRISRAATQMAAACCAVLILSGTAMAQAAGDPEAAMETRSMNVSLAGIDLGTITGRDQARQRIAQGVHRLYRSMDDSLLLSSFERRQSLEDASMNAAMSRLQVLIAAATCTHFAAVSQAPVS